MSHQTIEIPQEIIDANENQIRLTPSALRIFRESLGLSRSDVEDHTGLASSVVWRAEQETRHVPDEAYATIHNFLTYVSTAGRPNCCGRRSGKGKAKDTRVASSDTVLQDRVAALTAENAKLREELDAANRKANMIGENAAKLHATGITMQAMIDELERQLAAANAKIGAINAEIKAVVQDEIDQARAKKASTAALRRVFDFVNV